MNLGEWLSKTRPKITNSQELYFEIVFLQEFKSTHLTGI